MQVIDSFERSDLEYYRENTSSFETDSTRSTDGSRSLYYAPTGSYHQIWSIPGDGLDYYPEAGDTIEWDHYNTGGYAFFHFGIQDSISTTYGIEFSEHGMWLFARVDGSDNGIRWVGLDGTDHLNTWTHHEVEWIYDDSAHEVILNYTVVTEGGTEVLDISETDTTLIATDGGVGFATSSGDSDTWWDHVRAGEEHILGGSAAASSSADAWLSVYDTSVSNETIDDFERRELDHYSGTTSDFETDTSRTTNGGRSLHGLDGGSFSQIWSTPGDGLNDYPSAGDVIVWDQYITSDYEDTYFGVQGDPDNCYAIEFSPDAAWIHYYQNGSSSTLGYHSIDGTDHTNTWTHHTVDWQYDDVNDEVTIHYTIEATDGSTILDVTETDTDLVSTDGGIGFATGGSDDVWWDRMEVSTEGRIHAIEATTSTTGSATAVPTRSFGLVAATGGYGGTYGSAYGGEENIVASSSTTASLTKVSLLDGSVTASSALTGSMRVLSPVILGGSAVATSSASVISEHVVFFTGGFLSEGAAEAAANQSFSLSSEADGEGGATSQVDVGMASDLSVAGVSSATADENRLLSFSFDAVSTSNSGGEIDILWTIPPGAVDGVSSATMHPTQTIADSIAAVGTGTVFIDSSDAIPAAVFGHETLVEGKFNVERPFVGDRDILFADASGVYDVTEVADGVYVVTDEAVGSYDVDEILTGIVRANSDTFEQEESEESGDD